MSSSTLMATALIMGLVGSPHCAGMCGAACTGAISRWGGQRLWASHATLQLARASSYAIGGALAAGSMAWFKAWSDQVAALKPLWVLLQVAALVLGLWLLIRGQPPRWPTARNPAWQAITTPSSAAMPSMRWRRLLGVGALWVAWPCGLLQAALLVAALAGTAVEGALVMLVFALTSAVGLSWGVVVLRWLGSATTKQRTQAALLRLSGLMLVANTGWALAHSVQQATGFCATPV